MRSLSSHLLTIENFYTLSDIKNTIEDGDTSYPLENGENNGAEIEFKCVIELLLCLFELIFV